MIDLDKKSDAPAWDLELKLDGKVYPVKEPTGEQLIEMMAVKNLPPVEGYKRIACIFRDLTGADESIRVSLEQMLAFYKGFAAYAEKRTPSIQGKPLPTPQQTRMQWH